MKTIEVFGIGRIDINKRRYSIADITYDYLHGLCQTENRILKKIDKGFVELKKYLNWSSSQKVLFLRSEGITKHYN